MPSRLRPARKRTSRVDRRHPRSGRARAGRARLRLTPISSTRASRGADRALRRLLPARPTRPRTPRFAAYRDVQGRGDEGRRPSPRRCSRARPRSAGFVARLFGVEARDRGADRKARRPEQRALGLQEGLREEAALQGRPRGRGLEGQRGRARPTWRAAPSRPWARPRACSTAAPRPKRSRSPARCSCSTRSTTRPARWPRPAARSGRTSLRERAAEGARGARRARSDGGAVAEPSPTEPRTRRRPRTRWTRVEAWLAARRADHHDPARRWRSLKAPQQRSIYQNLVQLRRQPTRKAARALRRPAGRAARAATASRSPTGAAGRAPVESEVDYCLSATIATRTRAPRACATTRPAPSSRTRSASTARRLPARREDQRDAHHAARGRRRRRAGARAASTTRCCPGTGHRICNDCMKACVFQKQEPVNIPQIETAVLTDVLDAPVGRRDLRPAHAVEPAQRRAGRTRCPTTARTCSSSASARRATRCRTT